MKSVAEEVNRLGRFDAVIHNAGIGYREPRRVKTEPGIPSVFAVNVLAPYVLTALIERPDRLIYLSSGMHHGVEPRMDDLLWTKRPWNGASAYAESKLCDVLLAFAVARRWRNVLSNALEPGWVPTKMGGPSAPGDMSKAHLTQVWLAISDDPLARFYLEAKTGRVDDALASIDMALAIGQENGEHWTDSLLYRRRGEFLRNPGRPDQTCDRRRRRQADRERRRKRVQPAQARQGVGGRPDHDPFPFRRRHLSRL